MEVVSRSEPFFGYSQGKWIGGVFHQCLHTFQVVDRFEEIENKNFITDYVYEAV